MRQTSAKAQHDDISIDADAIRVGKDVIEILTTGMYVSPLTIYREYIQNAADSIDAARTNGPLSRNGTGEVSISFDHANRSVSIRDNGLGLVSSQAVSTLLAIGDSQKRGTAARGFRGVGRLSGLAYCRTLEFRTKAAGETKITSIAWDCRALRERLADSSFSGGLGRMVADVVSVQSERATDAAEHFFEVRFGEIARLRNDVLLNERAVADYLAQVAPLPFSPEFSLGDAITSRLAMHRQQLPINVSVAGQRLYRPYRDVLDLPGTKHQVHLEDIEFFDFADVDGGTGATGWIAHHEYVRSLPTALGVRGLRARVGDLQVGEANLFDECFKEPRFNGWSVGEIHIFDRRIVPNGRRDNFETNHHYYNLLVQLGTLATKITHRCRTASVSRNATQIVQNLIAEIEERLKAKRRFNRAEHSRLRSAVVRAESKVKRIGDSPLRQQMERKLDRLRKALAKVTPKTGPSVVVLDDATTLISKLITNREQANKLMEALRRLCE